MAVNAELLAFVKEALIGGMSRKEIEEVLLKAGWQPDQVKGALAAFADVASPVPVPSPKVYLSAREGFMYLLLFSTLYLSAYNLGGLLFEFINMAFPDPAMTRWVPTEPAVRIRWAVSVLIVAFPVFLYMSRLLHKALQRDPTLRASRIRKWLTYLTLFGAALVLIGDVIALINNLLGGELTVRFVLKALTVALIAGAVFIYYLWDLRHEEQEAVA